MKAGTHTGPSSGTTAAMSGEQAPCLSSLIRNVTAAGGRAAQLYTDGRRCRPFHRRDRTRKKKNITIRNMEEAT